MNWIKEIFREANQHAISRRKQKQFAAMLAAIGLCAFAYSCYREELSWNNKQVLLIAASGTFALIGFLYSKLFYPLLIVWFCIGIFLGKLSSILLYSLVYFLLITPISLILKATRKKQAKQTGWIDKTNPIDYTKLY